MEDAQPNVIDASNGDTRHKTALTKSVVSSATRNTSLVPALAQPERVTRNAATAREIMQPTTANASSTPTTS